MAPVHEYKSDCSVSAARCRWAKGLHQKARELFLVHLSCTHCKVAMANASGAADMAVDRNIEWRIRAYKVDGVVTHEKGIGAPVARISADQFVATQKPEVAQPRNGGRIVPIRWDGVLDRSVGTFSGTFARLVQNDIDFG